ncbi:swr complex subunit [Mortierella sp. GBA30]|nr:swr complex subunit [Mortierella sp. GBA30]
MKTTKEKKPEKDVDLSDSDSSDDEDYVPDDKADIQSEGEDSNDDSDNEQENSTLTHGTIQTTRSGKRRLTDGYNQDALKKAKAEEDVAVDETKTSRLDALWAEMNAPVSKPTSRPDLIAITDSTGSGTLKPSDSVASTSQSSSKMVTITTTYDFAGETVTVTKDVPENSKEAKEFALKNKSGESSQTTTTTTSTTITSASAASTLMTSTSAPTSLLKGSSSQIINMTEDPATDLGPGSDSSKTSSVTPRVTTRPSILDSLAKKGPVRYVRKKSNLDALAATYGVKKPAKLNTLEKSKLDWKNFVGKEGIEDELKHHNKDGYMEKVAFLQRTDERRDQEYQLLKKRK